MGSYAAQFTGRENDGTGLHYYRARYYSPGLQRVLSPAPLGFAAGDANLYRYVGNDPVNVIDPTGLFVDVVADVGFILYDLYRLRTDPCNFGWNLFALGLDVLGAFLPFATGLGFAARTADNLDDVADVARSCINSFSADTPVATPAGPVPISEIEVGDQVLAYHEATRTTGSYTVTDVIVHTDPVILALTLDGEVVETTPEHPFFVLLRGWVKAGDLRVGDVVRQRDGAYGMVNAVAVVAAPQPMYNLTVADAHTFFVGEEGWLVHNATICRPLTPREKDRLRSQATAIWEQKTGRRASAVGMDVHHRIPLEWAHLFPEANPNRVANLIGLRRPDHYLVNNAWREWKRSLNGATPTPAQVMRQALRIDEQFGHLMRFVK